MTSQSDLLLHFPKDAACKGQVAGYRAVPSLTVLQLELMESMEAEGQLGEAKFLDRFLWILQN